MAYQVPGSTRSERVPSKRHSRRVQRAQPQSHREGVAVKSYAGCHAETIVCDDAVHVVVGQKEPDRSAGRDVVEQEHYRLFMWDEEGGGGMQGRYHGEGEIMVRAREPEPLPYPSIPPSPTRIMWDARARGVA